MRALIAIPLLFALSGCGVLSGDRVSLPLGIGGGANELRRAPCACIEKEQSRDLPAFLKDSESGVASNEGVPA